MRPHSFFCNCCIEQEPAPTRDHPFGLAKEHRSQVVHFLTPSIGWQEYHPMQPPQGDDGVRHLLGLPRIHWSMFIWCQTRADEVQVICWPFVRPLWVGHGMPPVVEDW